MIRLVLLLLGATLLAGFAGAGFGWFQERQQAELAASQLFGAPASLPDLEVGLVLGTGPFTHRRNGEVTPNIPFVYRLDAATALWRAGKVKYLIVSGNRTGSYDEPTAMRAGLIARGVPANVIYRDFAGFRTIRSVQRARQIFGLRRLVIVSQKAHVDRAMFLARAEGIDAWGLAAREERPGGPGLVERAFLAGAALVAWWDVTTGAPPREAGRRVVIGVDAPN